MPLNTTDERELLGFYSARLATLWEKYLTIVNLVTSLAGATGLLFLSAIKIADWSASVDRWLVVGAIAMSGVALLLSLLWRFASQYFMEYETLGRASDVDRYFKICEIEPVTSAFRGGRLRGFFRIAYHCVPLLTILFLAGSWALVVAFVLGEVR